MPTSRGPRSRAVPRARRAQRGACVSLVAVVAAATMGLADLSAKDWPQWRGAERRGLWTETGILDAFPDEGLTVTWRVPINGGDSGPAVADGRVFVLDYVETKARTMDGTERILALSEETGEILWTYEWPTTYRMLTFSYATGPRATPTVDEDRVYVTGATGRIFCFNTETGAVIWEKDTVEEYDTSIPIMGTSSAGLVDGDRVIFLLIKKPKNPQTAPTRRHASRFVHCHVSPNRTRPHTPAMACPGSDPGRASVTVTATAWWSGRTPRSRTAT